MNTNSTRPYAVATAALELLPVPFLDTAMQNAVRTEMLRDLCRQHSGNLSDTQIAELAEEPLWDTSSVLRAVVLFPIKKLVGKLFWFVRALWLRSSYKDCRTRAERALALLQGPMTEPVGT